MKALRYLAGAFLALAATAHADTCQRTIVADGSSVIACPAVAVVVPPVVTPTPPPTDPTPPPPPPPPDPAPSACPPNISPFICALIGAGNATGGGGTTPAPSAEENFSDPTFVFRCGDQRRFIAESVVRSTIATHDATVLFTIGESSGNETARWHIEVSVNGRTAAVVDGESIQEATPPVSVKAGDMIVLSIWSREPGKKIGASIRLSVDGC